MGGPDEAKHTHSLGFRETFPRWKHDEDDGGIDNSNYNSANISNNRKKKVNILMITFSIQQQQ